MAHSTDKEIAADAGSLPYLTIAAALGRDQAFMAAGDALRADAQALAPLAKRYAPTAGRGRELIARMLSTAAAEPVTASHRRGWTISQRGRCGRRLTSRMGTG